MTRLRFRARLPFVVFVFVATSCSGTPASFTIANCEPADQNALEGELLGEAWQISTESQPGLTMLAVAIDGQDMGAVEPSADFWYFAASDSLAVLTGGLPSATTQAFGILADGSEVVFCPFGDGDLVAAGGSIPLAPEVVDLELRRGDSVVAIGHVSEARRLSPAPVFPFAVTPPGGATQLHGVVRGPGSQLTFEEQPAETTAP